MIYKLLLTLALCLLASQAWAAIAEVGAGSQRASKSIYDVASTTLAYPANVVSGNFLIVSGGTYSEGGAPASVVVTSTCSDAFTVLLSPAAGLAKAFIAYTPATSSAACTVTVDPAGTATLSFSIDEFSGVHATPLDVDGGSSTSTGTAASDDLTTTVANTLIIGTVTHASATTTLTPGGSYTQFGEIETGTGTAMAHGAVFRLATTAQAYTVDWTIGASVVWIVKTAAFAPAAAGGATSRRGPVIFQ